jgi:glutathione synthase/RimK-type ligase-like ATP-grasp enzyme
MNISKKLKFAILRNEDSFDHLLWVKACEDYGDSIDYQVIDLTAENWLKAVGDYCPDMLLLRPSCKTSVYRTLYQERLEILTDVLNYKSFPSINEVRLYENKRYFAYWVQANNVPHPRTWIFYNQHEALAAVNSFTLPLVGKMNIGASGNGVRILRTMDEVKRYIKQAFGKGLNARTGPKLGKGKLVRRLWHKLMHPDQLLNKLKTYKNVASDKQTGFVILQQYIPHDYEWRAVRIGSSYFAHKKLVLNDMASGSLVKEYSQPPPALLEFIRLLTEKFEFESVAVDLFEPSQDNYLVNEIQCIFGQSDPHQMIIDGKPGRYVYRDGRWVFEEGHFNANESFDLRLKTAIERCENRNR